MWFHGHTQKLLCFCIPAPEVAKHDGSACFLQETRLFKQHAVTFVSEMQLDLTERMSTTLMNFRKSFCTFRLHLQMGQKQWVVSFSHAAVQNGKNKLRWRRVKIQCLFWLMDFIAPLSLRTVSLLCFSIFLSVLLGSSSKDVQFFLEWILRAKRRTTAFHITSGNY